MKAEFSVDRRTFLKSTAILGGLSLALSLCGAGSARAKDPPPANPAGPSGKGYQLTEQVKKYYETARL